MVGVGAIVVVLAGSALAWACTSVATLESSPSAGQPGDELTLTGQNFDPEGSKVQILFNSMQGPVLAKAKPAADGSVTATITIPDVASGQYVLIADQSGGGFPVNGHAFGTPARLALVVPGSNGGTAPVPQSAVEPQPAASISTAESSSSTGPILLAVLGVAAAVLFIAGLASFLGEIRRREVGAAAPADN